MTFIDAVKTALKKYFKFGGTAGRPEYWWFQLFALLIGVIASSLDLIFFSSNSQNYIANSISILLVFPSITVLVRRFRDTSVHPLWLLTGLLPLSALVTLVIVSYGYFQDFYNFFMRLNSSSMTETELQDTMNSYVANHPEIMNALLQALGWFMLLLVFSLFTFVVSLLPTKKPKVSFAPTDY